MLLRKAMYILQANFYTYSVYIMTMQMHLLYNIQLVCVIIFRVKLSNGSILLYFPVNKQQYTIMIRYKVVYLQEVNLQIFNVNVLLSILFVSTCF